MVPPTTVLAYSILLRQLYLSVETKDLTQILIEKKVQVKISIPDFKQITTELARHIRTLPAVVRRHILLMRLVSCMCSIVKLHPNPWTNNHFWSRWVRNSPKSGDRTNQKGESKDQEKKEKTTALSWSSQILTEPARVLHWVRKPKTPPTSVPDSNDISGRWYPRDESPTPPYIRKSNTRRKKRVPPFLVFAQ